MPRGSKTCPKCNTITGPRAFKCPKCNYEFSFKDNSEKEKKLQEAFDWKALKQGEEFKSVGGGPFYKLKDGRKEPMGYKGIYSVKGLQPDGIIAFSKTKRETGYCFIYMGPRCKSTAVDGVIRRPHRLKRVVKREKQVA